MSQNFVKTLKQRYMYANVSPCCGRNNKDGKFVPFEGQEEDGAAKYGYCHSCGTTLLPPSDFDTKQVGSKVQKQKYIDPEALIKSRAQIKHDNLYRLTTSLWDETTAARLFVQNNVGHDQGETIFWLIDEGGRICQPKRMEYSPEGKRSGRIIVEPKYSQAEGYFPCAYNAVRVVSNPEKVVGVVESEKTALLCSQAFPDLVWIASGGVSGLSYDKALFLRDRDVLIFFDADERGREGASKTLNTLTNIGCNAKAIDLFPHLSNGYDLADFIVDYINQEELNNYRKTIREEIEKLLGRDSNEMEDALFFFEDQQVYLLDRFEKGTKANGITTRFDEVDVYWKWIKGVAGSWTGYPASGKSEMLLQLALLKAKEDGWSFILFMPESMSSDDGKITMEGINDTLAHTLVGKSTNIAHPNCMSSNEYKEASQFISEHFDVIYAPNKLLTPKELINYAEYLINKRRKNYDGLILDPWNHLISDMKTNELIDEYIRREISALDHLALSYDLSVNVVVHQSKPVPNKNGEIPLPSPYALRGGMAWYNGSYFVNGMHRPDYHKEVVNAVDSTGATIMDSNGAPLTYHGRNSPRAEFHSFKMKDLKRSETMLGMLPLGFDRKRNRYLTTDGSSPFDDGYRKRVKFNEPPKVQEYTEEELPF